jgi:hypothetical protein
VSIDGRHIGPDGRLLQSHHNNRTVTAAQVGEALARLRGGEKQRAIAAATGLSQTTVSMIATGTHWAAREELALRYGEGGCG